MHRSLIVVGMSGAGEVRRLQVTQVSNWGDRLNDEPGRGVYQEMRDWKGRWVKHAELC